jgi:sterol desaturase/sphingolipid hydroxylase (fatty acid hydroxylase superfamily)
LTTALRFHPLEIVLFILIELGIIVALEGSQVTMMLFEVVLNATAMFSHGNIYLPERLDRILRGMLVTLDMRRSHHSN